MPGLPYRHRHGNSDHNRPQASYHDHSKDKLSDKTMGKLNN